VSSPEPKPSPPRSRAPLAGPVPPECAQFDFLLGEWDARVTRYGPDGKALLALDGHWRADQRAGGRLLVDEFRAWGPDGDPWTHFVTLRTWCPALDRWEMTFLEAQQALAVTRFHGRLREGEMQLEAVGRDPSGRDAIARVRFFAIAPDGFRWEQQISADSHWQRVSSIRARRRAAG